MKSAVVDFETFYAPDYTLSKMTTEAYIRDPRFETILCGFKVGKEPAYWVPGPEVGAEIEKLRLAGCAVIAHHAHFDGLILSHHYDTKPAFWIDTLSMARAVHGKMGNSLAKLAERHNIGAKGTEVVNAFGKRRKDFSPVELAAYGIYCCNDCELEYKLAQIFSPNFCREELNLIDATVRMFTEPTLELRADKLQQYLKELKIKKASLLMEAGVQLCDITSNQKFAEALRFMGIDPPMKMSKTTGRPTYAFAKTDWQMQELAEHDDEAVQALIAARLNAKSTINETRAQRLLDMQARGVACVYLNYYGADKTGRASGGDKMNWQNFTRGGMLRESVEAPAGHELVVGDSANIESRMLDWLAGQEDQVEAYRKYDAGLGPDIYCVMAQKIYNRVITKEKDPNERFVGKTAKLGLGYGTGAEKFAITTKLHFMQAQTIVNIYRGSHAKVTGLWDRCTEALGLITKGVEGAKVDYRGVVTTTKGGLRLPNGMVIKYQDLEYDRASGWSYFDGKARQKIYGAKMCLAAGTDILAERGWVPIEQLTINDRVHDGVEFVTHGGIVCNSVQACVIVDGVYMTPDHEVLTDEGWKPALEEPRPYRPDLRHVNCTAHYEIRRQEDAVDVSLSVWEASRKSRSERSKRSEARRNTQLRLCDRAVVSSGTRYTRYEQASGFCSMALNVGPMPPPNTSGMEKLWRARNYCVQEVAQVRSFLAGYERYLSAGVNSRTKEQQLRVCAAQLHVGELESTGSQQTQFESDRCGRTIETNRHSAFDSVLPTKTWVPNNTTTRQAESTKSVYDITNCGPRQRFVVRGAIGPFIVHNCENITQALARIVVLTQTLMVPRRLVLSVHDEGVWCVPIRDVMQTEFEVSWALRQPLPWCPTLPLNCEVGSHKSYGKAKK